MVEKNTPNSNPEMLVVTETAGKILSSARIEWDLSAEEVARNLNLSVDTINALERNEYEQLPGYTFVKGYIRSYANLLRLDSGAILARVDLEPERLSEIPTSKAALKLKSTTRGKPKGGSGLFFKTLLMLVLLAALALFGLNQLSNLDTEKLSIFLKLPSSKNSEISAEAGDEIVFPTLENLVEKDERKSTDKKEALIRIE